MLALPGRGGRASSLGTRLGGSGAGLHDYRAGFVKPQAATLHDGGGGPAPWQLCRQPRLNLVVQGWGAAEAIVTYVFEARSSGFWLCLMQGFPMGGFAPQQPSGNQQSTSLW